MTVRTGWWKPSRRLLGDTLLIARGTVIGQAPFVLATPLITRLFPAAELGIYGVALAYVGITAPIAGLRFELAAISARNEEDARALLVLSALLIVPVTLACTALLCLLKSRAIGSYGALSWWLVALTGATVAAGGAYSTLRSWLARSTRFRVVANSLTLQGWLRAAIPVLFAPVAAGAVLLVSAELAARLSSVLLMARRSGLYALLAKPRLSAGSLRERAARFWKYPLLLAPSALIDAAATLLPVPIVATCYGLGAAGKFALVQRLVVLPAALIVGSVGDVFHAHAANILGQRREAVGGFLAMTAGRLLLLATVVYVPVGLLAPFTAGWVFGRQWSDIGIMIAALAPLCIAQTTVSPISRGLLLSGREERKLIADVVCLVLPLTTLYLTSRWPIIIAITCYSLAATFANGVYYLIIVQALKRAASPSAPTAEATGDPPRKRT